MDKASLWILHRYGYCTRVFLQGLDVLEIMKHIDVFVTQYCYNLNNQVSSSCMYSQ